MVNLERDLEKAVENLEPDDPDSDPEYILTYLQELAANPVNINRADLDELLLIPGLNFRLASAIVTYRLENAPFESAADLIRVPGLGKATVKSLHPYITAGSRQEQARDLYLNRKYWLNNLRGEMISRYRSILQKQDGYIRPDSLGGFRGGPVHYYQRFKFTSSKLSLNITQEKDPGEAVTGIGGFDYSSWHIAVQQAGQLQSLVIGDYSLSFGQGLLLWTGGSFGKSRDVVKSVSRNERGVRPYGSAAEAAGFRGVAFTYGNRLQISGFYSNRKRTASVRDSVHIRFPGASGYHRTISELSRRHNLTQKTTGGRLRYRFRNGHAGITGYTNHFSRPVDPGNLSYQQYRFSGHRLTGISADAGLLIRGSYLFTEGAFTSHGGKGLLIGLEQNLGPKTDAVVLFRRYEQDLQSIFGGAFGEQSGLTSNEYGFYSGLIHKIGSFLELRAYGDIYHFPAPRFRTSRPTSGSDYMLHADLVPHRKLFISVLARVKGRQSEYYARDDYGRDVRILGTAARQIARIQTEWTPTGFLRTRTRLERVRAETPEGVYSRGILFFQDLRLVPDRRVKLDMRITLFRTDDYQSRVYQFENDLLYVMSNTMLYGRGVRYYALLNLRTFSMLDIYAKVSTTVYSDRSEISSGNLRISGNRRSDAGIQVRLRL
ncbi:ComEA family DNA-binding protein [Rhodohalobacter mucosus]|nr:helix-hairpin-helix domain-containing protein [Rhodohalobacter mucosus]